ncbi:MAG: hypothetical protein RLZZ507_2081 [Cyanobacteriota bacterium]|jgi:hypothetical protein
MSNLTTALNRILDWLQLHKPDDAAGFLPGLSLEEIEEKVKVLPFRLPQAVYELYQWGNGSSNEEMIFVYHYFLSLDTAIELAIPEKDDYCLNSVIFQQFRQEDGKPRYVFPLFEFEGEYFAISVSSELQEDAAIYLIFHDQTLAFTSLSNMMLTIAECYETGVYSLDSEEEFNWDIQKFGVIRRQYNPEAATCIYAGE